MASAAGDLLVRFGWVAGLVVLTLWVLVNSLKTTHDIFASPATADRTSAREFWLDTTVGGNGQTRHSAHLLWSSVTHDPKSTGGTFVG